MAIKTLRVFAEYTSTGFVPMPTAAGIDYGYTLANTFPSTQPSTFQTDDPDLDVTVTAMTDFYVWIRISGTAWNPSYTRNVRVYPDSPDINNVVMNMIIATGPAGVSAYTQIVQTANRLYFNGATTDSVYNSKFAGKTYINELNFGTAPQLATVATSGAYADLTGKPALATVATSGSYADLSSKPSGTAPISYNSGTNSFQITQANSTTNGFLTSTDWNTFNNKYLLPSGGTTAQYLRGDGTLATFPTTLDSTRLILNGRNTTGTTLTKGTVVYINGVSGNTPLFARAIASADSTSAQTLGVVEFDIPNNSNGVVVLVGAVNNLDTSSYTEGVQLYLSGTVAGAFTSSKILAPTHLVYVGIVTRAHPTLGVIEVKIQNGYELDEIHDVQISSPADKHILYYDNATTLWKHSSVTSVLGFTPYNATNPSNYIALTALSASAPLSYNNTTGAFSIAQANGSTNGFLSSSDWTTFNNKQNALTLGNVSEVISNVLMFPDGGTNKTIGNLTIQVVQASASTNGFLSSANWTTFNNKQNAITLTTTGTSGAATLSGATLNIPQYQTALTNPVTGTGTTNYVTKWTSSSAVGNSIIFDNGTHVGIGTTTPNFTSSYGRSLSILAGTGYAGIEIFGASATGGGQLDFGGNTTRFASISGEYESSNNGYLNIRTLRAGSMTNAVRISANGNVGIGTTSPAVALEVNGRIRISSSFSSSGTTMMDIYNASSTGYGMYIGAGAGTNYAFKVADYANNERFTVLGNGNVGIGTSSPVGEGSDDIVTHINNPATTGAARAMLRLTNGYTGSTWGNGSFITVDSSQGLYIGNSEAAPMLLFTSGAERVRIASNGNLEHIMNDGGIALYKADRTTLKASFANPDGSNTDEGALYLYKANATKVQIRANGTSYFSGGNVGIGTSNPQFARLTVVGGAFAALRLDADATYNALSIGGTGIFSMDAPGVGGGRFRILDNGNVIINATSDPGYRLYVSGAIYATSNITANSDLTLKKNLQLVDNPIDKLNKLNGYLYQWKSDDSYQYGVIAQEVEKILPHAVSTGNDGIKGVSYNQIIPVLIEAVKIQQKEITELKAKIA